MIPSTQFGLPGKSTTKALEHLVNLVQQCWSPIGRAKLKATLMTIDITGAYDHVRRFELLKILRQKGRSRLDCAVCLVVSSATARLSSNSPDTPLKSFGSILALPQGSPLSPILFIFFSSPILEALQVSCPFASFALAVSYVDDTNILVTFSFGSSKLSSIEVPLRQLGGLGIAQRHLFRASQDIRHAFQETR